MQPMKGVAYARAGLLGNPSDGYGGKAIALSLAEFHASVYVEPDEALRIGGPGSDDVVFPSLHEAARHFARWGCEDGFRLLNAALRRFVSFHPEIEQIKASDPSLRFTLRCETNIPRQVGLAGSSAIVIAALRVLTEWFQRKLSVPDLAALALAAEVEDLGIAAGPMDRIVQAHQGVVVMDLKEPGDVSSYSALEEGLLPPLFVAWDPRGGRPSGVAHGVLRERWLSGDPDVLRTIQKFRDLVDHGLSSLSNGDHEAFRLAVTRNFELRQQIFEVGDADREMVALAQEQGASAKLCGSGGAVIGVPARDSNWASMERAYLAAGYRFFQPTVQPPDTSESA